MNAPIDGHGPGPVQPIRRRIISLLETHPMSVRDLSQTVGVTERLVVSHLDHVARSIRASDWILEKKPAVCQSCGFSFDHRRRFAKPGRCPRCRRTRTEAPVFFIRRP